VQLFLLLDHAHHRWPTIEKPSARNGLSRKRGALTEVLCAARAGVFNETMFRTVDTILDAASRAGLRVIVALVDNWQELDGVPSYLNVRGSRVAVDFVAS